MPRGIAHASRYLRESDAIAALLDAVARDKKLLDAIRELLPEPLDAHCQHASLDGSVLTLITDSPAWGSRLRFFAPEVATGLARSHGSIRSCRVRVQPSYAPPRKQERSRAGEQLTARTRRHLMAAADGLEYPEIADAFRRLAAAGTGR